VDKDDLLMAILADLEMPGLDPTSWKADDPAFGWTLALFRHFGSGKRLFKLQTVVRFLVGTFIGFMDWWMREENDHLPAEQVDHAFRALVLPGVAKVLELELELPKSL